MKVKDSSEGQSRKEKRVEEDGPVEVGSGTNESIASDLAIFQMLCGCIFRSRSLLRLYIGLCREMSNNNPCDPTTAGIFRS